MKHLRRSLVSSIFALVLSCPACGGGGGGGGAVGGFAEPGEGDCLSGDWTTSGDLDQVLFGAATLPSILGAALELQPEPVPFDGVTRSFLVTSPDLEVPPAGMRMVVRYLGDDGDPVTVDNEIDFFGVCYDPDRDVTLRMGGGGMAPTCGSVVLALLTVEVYVGDVREADPFASFVPWTIASAATPLSLVTVHVHMTR